MIKCYKLFQCVETMGNVYVKSEHRKLLQERCVIDDSYAERVNESTITSGKFYELDQAATDKYWNDCRERNERDAAAKLKNKEAAIENLKAVVSDAVSYSEEKKRAGRPKKD